MKQNAGNESPRLFWKRNTVKRLLDVLFLTVRNSRKIQIRIRNRAAVDASRIAWVSPLLFYPYRQCEKPLTVGQRHVRIPTLSLCLTAF
ncbi:MAG: hypothetical protein J1E38_03535 [Paramuribaculum sp.]|nr:hypothetical protein [Paramuribaculum sp.]